LGGVTSFRDGSRESRESHREDEIDQIRDLLKQDAQVKSERLPPKNVKPTTTQPSVPKQRQVTKEDEMGVVPKRDIPMREHKGSREHQIKDVDNTAEFNVFE